jgi:hypothetical protein
MFIVLSVYQASSSKRCDMFRFYYMSHLLELGSIIDTSTINIQLLRS